MDYFLFLKAVLDYIENRVAEEMSADQVAAAAGFSPAHLREIFSHRPDPVTLHDPAPA